MATYYPLEGTSRPPSETVAVDGPVIRHIGFSDLLDALRLGWEDFKAVPSHAIVLCVIYPIIGILLWRMVLGYSVLPMLVPIAAGFALIGPFAALGLYELSYRRELGQEASAWHAFGVLRAPSFGSMLGLGALLFAIFVAWVVSAHAIYVSTFGNTPAAAIPDFFTQVFTTSEGWRMIMVGVGVGFLFAAVALCISIVSFPLMLHQHADMSDAILTSMRMVAKNPIAAAEWGLIVAVLLTLGSIPFFLGLTIVMPLLGHATWHLYRKAIESPLMSSSHEPEQIERESATRPISRPSCCPHTGASIGSSIVRIDGKRLALARPSRWQSRRPARADRSTQTPTDYRLQIALENPAPAGFSIPAANALRSTPELFRRHVAQQDRHPVAFQASSGRFHKSHWRLAVSGRRD